VPLRRLSSLIVLAVAGCAAPATAPDAALLAEAERLCLDGLFADAAPMLREYLRADPENAVAHYYLGRCYLSGDLINLPIARGEFGAAFALYQKHGQASPQGRFTDEYFQLMCLADTAKTYLSEIMLVLPAENLPPNARLRATRERLRECERLYRMMKEIAPDDHLTGFVRDRIDIIAKGGK
jgi:tetratricopeptide (TPR) repeat protein